MLRISHALRPRGVVIQGADGKELVVADIAYDSEAVLDCLLQSRPVPYYSLQDEKCSDFPPQ